MVHTWTVQGVSFFNRDLLKDRNFVTGLLFAFIVGMILYGTMALLPSFLQGLMGYPVVYTGRGDRAARHRHHDRDDCGAAGWCSGSTSAPSWPSASA